jgi:periplasmic protein TonB
MSRDVCGFSLSFFMHAAILGVFLYVCPTLDLQPKTQVIDFSLISESIPRSVYPVPAKPDKKPEASAVVKVPPKPRQLAKIKPIAKVLPKVQPKKMIPPKTLARPVEKILPLKEEKVVQQEIQQESVVTAGPEEIPAEASGDQPRSAAAVSVTAAALNAAEEAPGEIISGPAMEQQYVKAHFIYIKKIVEKNISYPAMARRMGWQGKVVVSFVVCLNGEVENLQVIESSGYAQLDKNALETIKQVKPFPSPPVRVKLVLPVTYRMT